MFINSMTLFDSLRACFSAIIFTALCVAGSPQVSAAPRERSPLQVPEYAVDVRPPEFLFHWTSSGSLERLALSMQTSEGFQLKPDAGSGFTSIYQRVPRGILFAWSNPITAMGADAGDGFGTEIYARSTSTSPARLLVMKIKPGAKVRTIITGAHNQEWFDGETSLAMLAKDELILHLNFDSRTGKVKFQEWIILDPKVVESFSADPEIARPFIERELHKLRNPAFKYSEAEVHYFGDATVRVPGGYPLVGEFRKILHDFLTSGTNGIPSKFLGNLGRSMRSSPTCSQLFRGL